MKDYSQSREQGIILDYFKDFRGTAISLGENDGETLSNVRALGLLNWKLVCVEPAPIAFRKLASLYVPSVTLPASDDQVWAIKNKETGNWVIQAAITTQDGPIDFYDSGTHLKKGDTSLLSTTRPEELARWKKSGEVFTKTTVRGITVATLLKETGLARADFISIDCEGVDLSVLQQLDLTALQTRMVCVEVNQSPETPFMEYLASHGFRKHFRNFENLIAVKA
jgi:FkbM family methyltransferase